MNELAEKLQQDVYLDFSEEELREAKKEFEGSLLVKIIGNRSFKKGVFIQTFKKLWGQQGIVKFVEIENNVLVASFSNEEDKVRVLNNGPWLHLGWAVLVTRWVAGKLPDEMFTNKIQIALQVHNLPLEMRTENSARKCAQTAGKVLGTIMPSNNGHTDYQVQIRRFHRFRIEIDLNKALAPGCFLGKKELNPPKAIFRYEKLPNLCHNCGLFDHETSRCVNQPRNALITYDKTIRAEYTTAEEDVKMIGAQSLGVKGREQGGPGPSVASPATIESELPSMEVEESHLILAKSQTLGSPCFSPVPPPKTFGNNIGTRSEEVLLSMQSRQEEYPNTLSNSIAKGGLLGPDSPIPFDPTSKQRRLSLEAKNKKQALLLGPSQEHSAGLLPVVEAKGTNNTAKAKSIRAQTVAMKRTKKGNVTVRGTPKLNPAKLVEVSIQLGEEITSKDTQCSKSNFLEKAVSNVGHGLNQ